MGIKNPGVLIVDDDYTIKQANAANKRSPEMNAIAIGVEAKLDPFSAYSETATRKTMEIARQLRIAEEERQRWAMARANLASKRDKVIKAESIWNRSSRDEFEQ